MDNKADMTEFQKLFWEQQKEASKKKSMQYHPMMIRFCLSLTSKSAAAYDELRDTKILKLPNRKTLGVYRNAIKPQVGFNPKVIAELKAQADVYEEDYQRYVCVSFDEMKIQENLVFDKNTNELIGFVDLGDEQLD